MQEKELNRNRAKLDRVELALGALDSCSECIDAITEGIRTTTGLYQAGSEAEASQKFGDVVELIDLFVQLMSQVQRALRSVSPGAIKDEEMQALEMHLLGILKALIPAKEKGDVVMLCDLLEYELVDNLTQWKIKAIPQLKSQGALHGPGDPRP